MGKCEISRWRLLIAQHRNHISQTSEISRRRLLKAKASLLICKNIARAIDNEITGISVPQGEWGIAQAIDYNRLELLLYN